MQYKSENCMYADWLSDGVCLELDQNENETKRSLSCSTTQLLSVTTPLVLRL